MTDWKPLPDGLASDVRHLVVELRTLKDRTGLSLATLAKRTPHSKSSWERYLNGKALPSQHAVASLGKLAGADPARLAALWELASTAWHEHDASGRPAPASTSAASSPPSTVRPSSPPSLSSPPSPSSPSSPSATERPAAQSGRRLGGRRLLWAAAVLAVAAVSGAALLGLFGRTSHPRTGPDDTSAAKNTATRQLDVNCFADSCAGKNPKDAGCGGDAWTSALDKVAGVYVELRYSDACKAAWARISWGIPGDIARVVAVGGQTYQNKVHYDTDTFSAMVPAPSPSSARACVLLTSGVHACTEPGGTQRLTEAPNPPTSPSTSPSATGPSAPTPSLAPTGRARGHT